MRAEFLLVVHRESHGLTFVKLTHFWLIIRFIERLMERRTSGELIVGVESHSRSGVRLKRDQLTKPDYVEGKIGTRTVVHTHALSRRF
jgi:hypothetical protein